MAVQFATIAPAETPKAVSSGATAADRAIQEQYNEYVLLARQSAENGKLTPDGSETMRSVKMRVRRAASRLNLDTGMKVWDVSGIVYFSLGNGATAQ